MTTAHASRPYTEIAMLVLAQGVSALDGIPQVELKRRSVLRACKELKKLGQDGLADALSAAYRALPRGPGKGSKVPRVGERRHYEVQRTKAGHDWVRLPTGPIGAVRGGDGVCAHFIAPLDGSVTVDAGEGNVIQFSGPVIVVAAEESTDGAHQP